MRVFAAALALLLAAAPGLQAAGSAARVRVVAPRSGTSAPVIPVLGTSLGVSPAAGALTPPPAGRPSPSLPSALPEAAPRTAGAVAAGAPASAGPSGVAATPVAPADRSALHSARRTGPPGRTAAEAAAARRPGPMSRSLRRTAAFVKSLRDPFTAPGPGSLAAAAETPARQPAGAASRRRPGAGPDSLAEISLEPEPGRVYTPSPEDWRDEIVYSLMIDRFNRGADPRPVGDPASGVSRHGGNIDGVTEALDYVFALGARVIKPTPVTGTLPGAYHGYAGMHLMDVDEHIGSLADYKRMVEEAHRRGGWVLKDFLINHTGPLFEYRGGSAWSGLEGPPKEIGEWLQELKPIELSRAEHFSRRGVIHDWANPEQARHGDFPPNYRHFATERPETQDLIIKIAQWWIRETDIDGMRLDAVRHVDPGFLERFKREVRAYASSLGKRNFFFLEENSSGKDEEIAPNLHVDGDSAYNYPAYRRENHALHGKAPASRLEESFRKTVETLGAVAGRLLRFIDNQDVYRFLRKGEPAGVLEAAFAYLLFSTGIPMIYYGTEQAFRQAVDRLAPEDPTLPADPGNREDMFEGGAFKSESSEGDKFLRESPMFLWVQKLARLRRELPALRRGEQWVRWADVDGPGIYAFSRVHEGQEVVVVINTAGEDRTATLWVDEALSPPGTRLADVLHPGEYETRTFGTSKGGSHVPVAVPAHGVRLLVKTN